METPKVEINEKEYYPEWQNGILFTLKNLFRNILLTFTWTDNSETNKKGLLDEFNKICNCFIEGGLIYDFQNIATGNVSNTIQESSSIMDTVIIFTLNGTSHMISSIVKTDLDFKIMEDLDTIKPHDFLSNVENTLKYFAGAKDGKLEFLEIKKDEVRRRKMFNINKQQFEPAADWRDVERMIIDLIGKEKENLNVFRTNQTDAE